MDLGGLPFRLLFAPLMSTAGAADEEEAVVALEADGPDPGVYRASVRRAAAFSAGRACHVVALEEADPERDLLAGLAGVRAVRLLLDLEAYDSMGDDASPVATVDVSLSSPAPSSPWARLRPEAGRRTTARAGLSPSFADFDEATAADGQQSAGGDYDFEATGGDGGRLDPGRDLTAFERCRLLRQLGRRCSGGDHRRRSLESAHPGLCAAVGDFFPALRFPACVDSADPGAFVTAGAMGAVDEYARRNLALVEVELDVEQRDMTVQK